MGLLDLILCAFVAIFIIGTLWIIMWNPEKHNGISALICAIVLFLITMLFCAIASQCNQSKIPSALDVYRDKTELQITYQDTIPVDTVVVFKKLYE